MAGIYVRDRNQEKKTDDMTPMAKSLKSSPSKPGIKNIGKKTTIVVTVPPKLEAETSITLFTICSWNFVLGRKLFFLLRFSKITAPASTTIPTPTATPDNDMILRVFPSSVKMNKTIKKHNGIKPESSKANLWDLRQ